MNLNNFILLTSNMKLDSLGRPSKGPEKLKLERLKQQIPIIQYIKQELMNYNNKKINQISSNKEIANKFNITKRKLNHYLTDYLLDTDHIISKKELKIRKSILQRQQIGDKNPFYGKKHSEESKLKMKKAYKIRPQKESFCVRCNKKMFSVVYNRRYCSSCKKSVRKEIMAKTDKKRAKNPKRILQKLVIKRKYNQTEKAKATDRNWRKNTEKGISNTIFNNLKRRERLANVKRGYTKKEWFEKVEQAKLIGICPKCKHPLTKGARSQHQLTMDHHPSLKKAPKGFVYTIKNVAPLCFSCNARKQAK